MSKDRSTRALTILTLAEHHDVSQKQIAARTGMTDKMVSHYLAQPQMEDEIFARFLAAVEATPLETAVATGCHETLRSLMNDRELTGEEREMLEREVLEVAREVRAADRQVILLSREAPPRDEYPRPAHVEPARWLAREHLALIAKIPRELWLEAARAFPELHAWAFSEAAADASVEAASQNPEKAMALAELAVEVAEQVQGPEGWLKRLRGFALAHRVNALKVYGRLKDADAELEKARPLWEAGSDPDKILDPGRLFDIEASLRRAQRRFEESLALSKKAVAVSRYPARALILNATTLHVMGDYEAAVETLLQAEPKIDDLRLWYQQRFNLATNYSLVDQYAEAEKLIGPVRVVALKLGDEIFLHRVTWLAGRTAAGLERREEALRLLEQARQEFETHEMWFDVALALLETLGLLLKEGRTAEVKALSPGLARVFASEEVHPEALAALQLFQEAVEQETATAELARRVLTFLLRARYDPGLQFNS